jgi:phage tail-like protein
MAAMSLSARSSVSRYFSLVLDGYEPAGFLRSVDGGGIKGELIAQQVGGQPYRVKHINNPLIEPVTVQVGMAMSDSFYEWVKLSWAGECQRRNGSIITADFKRKAVHELQFTEALVLETTIPTLDAASKEAAYMTVKFQAETAKHVVPPDDTTIQAVAPTKQKLWHSSNFGLELDGIDARAVSKIDSFTVKQNVKPMTCGPDWMYQIEPTSLEYPNLTVYLSQAHADDFMAWHEDFVVAGNNRAEKEKTGSIIFLNSNRTKELLRVNLNGVGIVNLVAEKADVGTESIRRFKAELYVEEMQFEYKDSTGA